jgi:hypothetical protein
LLPLTLSAVAVALRILTSSGKLGVIANVDISTHAIVSSPVA